MNAKLRLGKHNKSLSTALKLQVIIEGTAPNAFALYLLPGNIILRGQCRRGL